MTRPRSGRAKGGGSPGRAFAVRSALVVMVSAVLPSGVAAAVPEGTFGWPLRPRPALVRPFDPPEHDWLPGHRGVDLAGSPGQTVYAAGPGVVVFAGEVAGKPVVSIAHDGALRTTYEPVEAEVTVGRRVSRGTPVGVLKDGHEGCGAAACLHWGLRRERTEHGDREYLDPLGLLELSPIRLKPVDPASG